MVTAKADQFRQDMQRQEENRNLLQQHLANQYNQDINAKAHAEQLKVPYPFFSPWKLIF